MCRVATSSAFQGRGFRAVPGPQAKDRRGQDAHLASGPMDEAVAATRRSRHGAQRCGVAEGRDSHAPRGSLGPSEQQRWSSSRRSGEVGPQRLAHDVGPVDTVAISALLEQVSERIIESGVDGRGWHLTLRQSGWPGPAGRTCIGRGGHPATASSARRSATSSVTSTLLRRCSEALMARPPLGGSAGRTCVASPPRRSFRPAGRGAAKPPRGWCALRRARLRWPYASGASRRTPAKRSKSRSNETIVHRCSSASAARCASFTRLPPTPTSRSSPRRRRG